MPSSPVDDLARVASRALAVLLSVALAILGFVIMIGALLVGLVVAAVLVLWSLLRGRRPPPMPFRWGTGMARGRWRQASSRSTNEPSEVIDVQVREVKDRVDP